MVNIKPLANDEYLAARQEQMVEGLLKLGLKLADIKDLSWYEPRLERVNEPPVSTSESVTQLTEPVPEVSDKKEARAIYMREYMAKKRAKAKGSHPAGTPVSEI